MISKPQFAITLTWVFGPILLFIVLYKINPDYELLIVFSTRFRYTPLSAFVLLEAVNLIVLMLGFMRINYRVRLSSRPPKITLHNVSLALITLVGLTLPALTIVALAPAMIFLFLTTANCNNSLDANDTQCSKNARGLLTMITAIIERH